MAQTSSSTPLPVVAPGMPPLQPGSNIEGPRPPGRKTVGKDHRFKVKKGIDLQSTNVIGAKLIPTQPDELASKEYVDRVAVGTAGSPGLTQNAADSLYLSLNGGTVTGPLSIQEAKTPTEAVTLGQVQDYFHVVPDFGGLAAIVKPLDGSMAFVQTTGQTYGYYGGSWVGISTLDNPQGGPVPSPGTALSPGRTVGEKVDIGTTTFQWNGVAWDRLTPIDFSRVRNLEVDAKNLLDNQFLAPKANAVKPNSAGINDLNAFLAPGSYRILSAANSPEASGSLIVTALGSGSGIGSNVAVEQMFFAWTEGTTAATIEAGDVYVRVGYGQVWSPWERVNQQWIEDLVNSRIGVGIRFVGLYDAATPEIITLPRGVGAPYVVGQPLPDPATVQDRDYLVVKVDAPAPINDPNLPTLDDDGNPLSLRIGDYLVAINGVWHRVTASSVTLPIPAVDVSYVNTGSGLAASTAQGAIDELALGAGAWKDISPNDADYVAGVPVVIATGGKAAMFELDLYAASTTGTWAGKIVGARINNIVSHSIAWEQVSGSGTAPDVGFSAAMGTGTAVDDILLTLTPLDDAKIRGKYMMI